MKAFMVHDNKKKTDIVVIPETNQTLAVNRIIMEEFIAVKPDFSKYSGDPLNHMPPETLGIVIATRKSDGDVCIIDESVWQQRMTFHLSG